MKVIQKRMGVSWILWTREGSALGSVSPSISFWRKILNWHSHNYNFIGDVRKWHRSYFRENRSAFSDSTKRWSCENVVPFFERYFEIFIIRTKRRRRRLFLPRVTWKLNLSVLWGGGVGVLVYKSKYFYSHSRRLLASCRLSRINSFSKALCVNMESNMKY